MTYADNAGLENGCCGGGPFGRLSWRLKAAPVKLWGKLGEVARQAKKLGQDDPRRIVHSCKVGLALMLVSLFYYFRPIHPFGADAMWAILTVALVFEYSVGGTLERGLNRMMATIVAGPLAVGLHYISTLWGGAVAEPILIGVFVFVVGEVITTNRTTITLFTSVLTSKGPEDFMANLAWWEPGHGRFKFRHPWNKYLNVGAASRECAYKIEALNTYLNNEIQAPTAIQNKIQEPCTNICIETGKALKELAAALTEMTLRSSANYHIARSKAAAESLTPLLKGGIWKDANVLEIVPSAAVAFLLIEVVTCVEKIAEAFQELASSANFKTDKGQVLPEPVVSEAIIHIPTVALPETGSSGWHY